MSLSREEIFAKISEMGKSAGENFEKSSNSLYQLLIILNGSGLVASLAFIGTILTSKAEINFLPFYWSTVSFGIGIISCLIILICHFYYFFAAVQKYSESYLQADPNDLVELAGLSRVLAVLASATCYQIITGYIQDIATGVSIVSFILGMIFGFHDFHYFNSHFPLVH